ncbi:hypothetical protein NP233_g12836 [Leucocoprinus birnbaumii]|uniref:Uncharacterized protein n=1 Tax=Leucocoprinus birnbaumii TaxID=56174 RepID=A0AAD5YK23_9AGAR|nr:hypothetical protein NP233_g12836 [Leucocoprinus birnbaumii]
MGDYVILREDYLETKFQWVSLVHSQHPNMPDIDGPSLGDSRNRPGHICFEYLLEGADQTQFTHYMDYATQRFYLAYYLVASPSSQPILHLVTFDIDPEEGPRIATNNEILLPTAHNFDSSMTMNHHHICIYEQSFEENRYACLSLDIINQTTRNVSQFLLIVPEWKSLAGQQQKRVHILETCFVLVAWDTFAIFPHSMGVDHTASPAQIYASFTGKLPTPVYNLLPCPSATPSFTFINFDYYLSSKGETAKIRLFFVDHLEGQWRISAEECTEVLGTQSLAILPTAQRGKTSQYALGVSSCTGAKRPSWWTSLLWNRTLNSSGVRVPFELYYTLHINLSREPGGRFDSNQGFLTVTKMHLVPCVDEERERGGFVAMDPFRGRLLVFVGPYDRSSSEPRSVAVLDYLSKSYTVEGHREVHKA